MKKFIFILLFSIFFLPNIVFADGVEIILNSTNIVGYTGEITSVDATIRNNQDFEDVFSITIWPSFWSGITALPEKYLIKLNPLSNFSTKIYFIVAEGAEEIFSSFNITVRSSIDEKVSDSKTLNLKTVRKVPVFISDIKMGKYVLSPGEEVKIECSITNRGDEEFMGSIKTIVRKETIIQRFDDEVIVSGKNTEKTYHSFITEKYSEPGVYSVEVVLFDREKKQIDSKSISFRINEVRNIIHEKIVSYGLMTQTVTIKVRNEGNSPATDFFVTEDVPSFIKPFFIPIESATVEIFGDRILYHWLIPSLLPGEERIIKYKISLWNAWGVVLIIIISVIVAFNYVYSPKILKRVRHFGPLTRENEITVLLEVKNRSKNEIKDVMIRDLVPPILKIVERFDTVKPSLRKTANGTELIWKFDSLKPKEERVLSYRIKPTVEILGSLKLPKAIIKYTDKKRVKKTVISKKITVRPE